MDTKAGLSQCIRIRPLMIYDFDMVVKWSKDRIFCLSNGWETNISPTELFKWWINCVRNEAEDFVRMGIEYKGKLIGYTDLAFMKDQAAELGIAIGESQLWGKGIGAKSAICMMEYGLANFGITTYHAETNEQNIASRKMLEKIGFEEISREGSEVYRGIDSQLIQYRMVI